MNSPVDRSSSATPSHARRSPGAIGHQKRRLARFEIAAVGEGSSETTRTTSRLTSPLAFFGSSTCSHIGDAKALRTRRAM